MATDLNKLTAALANGNTVEAWRILERGAWEPLQRMAEDVTPTIVDTKPYTDHYTDHYAENPPHGAKGHRVSRYCDQCVENAS